MEEKSTSCETIRLGVTVADHQRDPSDTRDYVRELDALGVDSLWAPGHIAIGRHVPEALTGLARLACLSEQAIVGTAVLLLPLYHPVLLAKQLAELDRISGGRLAVGIGVGGEYPLEFDACGVRLSERGPRADEAIDVLRTLWASEPAAHTGRFWTTPSMTVLPPPARKGGPPIIVAGRKKPAMRRAALRGDGWMPFLYSPGRYRRSVETIRTHAADAGRSLEGFDWECFIYVSMHDDPAEARRRALEFVGGGQAGDPTRFETVIDELAVIGDVETVHAGLQDYVDAGARHLILLPCERDRPLATITRIKEQVLPHLRAPT